MSTPPDPRFEQGIRLILDAVEASHSAPPPLSSEQMKARLDELASLAGGKAFIGREYCAAADQDGRRTAALCR